MTVRDRIPRPPVIDYKLRDVPELGYYTTDKPYPRGELCVKTDAAAPRATSSARRRRRRCSTRTASC